MTELQKEQIKAMRQQGLGYMKIGQELNISVNTVRSFCRRNESADSSTVPTVQCMQCGKVIRVVPKRKAKKFCSDACRTAWWNSHLDCVDRKAVYYFTCAYCGVEFTAYGNQNRKYCSRQCYLAHRFGKERECHE